jgi:hypothetical protein
LNRYESDYKKNAYEGCHSGFNLAAVPTAAVKLHGLQLLADYSPLCITRRTGKKLLFTQIFLAVHYMGDGIEKKQPIAKLSVISSS